MLEVCCVVSVKQGAWRRATTNGRTKKCLPSGEPVSRNGEALSRMTGHECDGKNVKLANVVDASSLVMFVLLVIEAIERFQVPDLTGFDEHVQRSGGGRSAVGRLRHGQERGVNVVRHFHMRFRPLLLKRAIKRALWTAEVRRLRRPSCLGGIGAA